MDGIGQMELKLQAGKVWGRVAGQAWEPLDETAAPDLNTSDPAAFLEATRNVQLGGTEERLGQTTGFSRLSWMAPPGPISSARSCRPR